MTKIEEFPHVGVGQFSSGEVVSILNYFGFHHIHVVQFDWSLLFQLV